MRGERGRDKRGRGIYRREKRTRGERERERGEDRREGEMGRER